MPVVAATSGAGTAAGRAEQALREAIGAFEAKERKEAAGDGNSRNSPQSKRQQQQHPQMLLSDDDEDDDREPETVGLESRVLVRLHGEGHQYQQEEEDFYCTSTIKTLYVRFCEEKGVRFIADPSASARTARVFASVELEEPETLNPDGSPVIMHDVMIMKDILQQFDTTIQLPQLPRVLSQTRCMSRWQLLQGGGESAPSSHRWENVKVAVNDVGKYLRCEADAGLHVVVPVDVVVALVEAERSRLQGLLWKRSPSPHSSPSPQRVLQPPPSPQASRAHVDPSNTPQHHHHPSPPIASSQTTPITPPERSTAPTTPAPTSSSLQYTDPNPATTTTPTSSSRLTERRSSSDVRDGILKYLQNSRTAPPSRNTSDNSITHQHTTTTTNVGDEHNNVPSSTTNDNQLPIPATTSTAQYDYPMESEEVFSPVLTPTQSWRRHIVPTKNRMKDLLGRTSSSSSAIFQSNFNNSERPPTTAANMSSPSPQRSTHLNLDIGTETNTATTTAAGCDQSTQYESLGLSKKETIKKKSPSPSTSMPRAALSHHHPSTTTRAPPSRLVPSSRHATSSGYGATSQSYSRDCSASRTSYSRNTSRCPSPARHNGPFKLPGSINTTTGLFADVRSMPATPPRRVASPSRVMAALREQERSLKERIRQDRYPPAPNPAATVVVSGSTRRGSTSFADQQIYPSPFDASNQPVVVPPSPRFLEPRSNTPLGKQVRYPSPVASTQPPPPPPPATTSRSSSVGGVGGHHIRRLAPPAPRISSPKPTAR